MMNQLAAVIAAPLWRRHKWMILGVIACLVWVFQSPQSFIDTLLFVLRGMLEVSYLVVPGIVISAWVNASGAGGRIRRAFVGNQLRAVLAASLVGAITPVCGVTVLPLMAGLLAAGVPLAPVMAFWLASPVTDPAMFSVTAATLGFQFALAKSAGAFLLGVFGGMITTTVSGQPWIRSPLRAAGLAAELGEKTQCASDEVEFAWWRDPARNRQFGDEVWAITKLIVICLGLAFAAEFQMQAHLQPETFAGYLGKQSSWAIPLAVLVGSPAYLDGYAALPLTRGLIDHGMSPGAAMAFLVSGSVVSIWGAIAIFPVLRVKPFLLYLMLALVGSLALGWLYDGLA